jgi:hypothetical protein
MMMMMSLSTCYNTYVHKVCSESSWNDWNAASHAYVDMHGMSDSCDRNTHIATHSNGLGDVLQVLNHLYEYVVLFCHVCKGAMNFNKILCQTR